MVREQEHSSVQGCSSGDGRQARLPFPVCGFSAAGARRNRSHLGISHLLPAVPAISPAAATTAASFSRAEAVLAINRPVASRLKRNRRLLSASGTRHRRGLGFTPAVSSSSAATLFILLCLAARLAALRSRISAFSEEVLILGCKRKFLSAVAAGELHIFRHKNPFAYFLSCTPCPLAGRMTDGLSKAAQT